MLDEQLENELRMRERRIEANFLLAAEANRNGDNETAEICLRSIAAERRETDYIRRLLRQRAA